MNALHVHRWGKPWTDGYGFFDITEDLRTGRIDAATEVAINAYINQNGPVFWKLSTASPKDVEIVPTTSAKQLMNTLVRSNRIAEYLEHTDQEYQLCLKPWDSRISLEREYRCFVFQGKCEAISRIIDCEAPDPMVEKIIMDYIANQVDTFPEQDVALDICLNGTEVIFIEFNPIDECLDRYGIIDRGVPLSEYAYAAMLRPIL